MVNYFEVLGLTIEQLENKSETEIKQIVADKHSTAYNRALAMASNPHFAEKDIADMKDQVALAKDILTDPEQRRGHIEELKRGADSTTDDDGPDVPQDRDGDARTIVKFSNGDIATSIPQLATLMEKNSKDATDMLYLGYLEQGLAGVGEAPFAKVAREVVNQFSSDRSTGVMAMVAILRGKVKMQRAGDANTPQQLARLIDQNWGQSKTLLYNGFIGFWLEHTSHTQLANIAKKITSRYGREQDIGLEMLVQRLNPQIGNPKPEISHSDINFGRMDTGSQKTVRFKIKNVGRGFLYGDVQLESDLPGLQISDPKIQGNGEVTVKLDTGALTAKQAYQGSLVVNTNGGNLKVPVSCYIDNPIQQSVQRVAISGLAVAAIALVTRLILQQFGLAGWLARTGFTNWEHHWSWVEWFEWPWLEWKVYTLGAAREGLGFIIALALLGTGIFAYWYFFFKKKIL